MKTRQKILLTALSAALVATMTSGLTLTALADQTTEGHEFDAKTDVVFEDFDRETITDTVKDVSRTGADIGEKPYLHVKYTAGKSTTPGDAIYKQGSGSLNEVSSGGTITLKMRAPEGDVDLSEIIFGVRGVDNDAAVLGKTLEELLDSQNNPLPALTDEWQDYEISFATSYEDTDLYPTTQSSVPGTPLLAIHLYAAEDAVGTLDIASVSYNKTGNVVMNDFRGGDTVEPTAKLADSGTWWAGSSEGYIVKRAVKLTEGGSFSVVKTEAVGDYKYAIIETAEEDDVTNLKIATTTDGTTWGEAEAYDGYSVALTGEEKGFRFTYEGNAANGVTVRRIYLTNDVRRAPETVVPVIDASSAQILEDFSFAQKGFTDVYEDMSTVEGLADAGLDYRLSYANGNLAEVKDGCLVFDATTLAANDYIDFKFKSKSVVQGQYAVLRMKAEGGADLGGFRFALIDSEDAVGDVIWSNAFKVAYGLATPLLGESNPYHDGDWYYVVVDLEESGFKLSEAGYSGMHLYFGGTGKLYIDTIFFADKLPEAELCSAEAGVEPGDATGYAYGGGFALDNKYGIATVFSFDLTPKGDGFTPDNLRFEMGSGKFYWGSENAQGTLLTKDGKKLNELTYTKGVATHIEIDMQASGIGAFDFVHVHTSDMGGFKLDNIKLLAPKQAFKGLSDTVVTIEKTFTAAPTAEQTDYTYIDGADVTAGKYGKLEFTVTPGADFDGTDLRVEIKNGADSVATIWIAQQGETVITADGKKYSEIVFEEGTPVNFVFDLIALNADTEINQFHVHSTGIVTGPFTVSDVKFTAMADNYAEQVEKLPVYLDTVKPEVHITTPTTAKAGDTVTVAYNATDDTTAAADLQASITVTKDGEAVTLTENKFTAEEGVYTVIVTVRDANGNEGKDTIQITVSAQQSGGTTPGGTTEDGNGGLSTGAIVGIIIGAVAGVALICGLVFFLLKKKKN